MYEMGCLPVTLVSLVIGVGEMAAETVAAVDRTATFN